jgi:ribulose-5-phosphate 4-epimerase/fuculose-1-phosphate aldolase
MNEAIASWTRVAAPMMERDPNDTRPDHIDEAEWALRVQLAAAYRIFHHLGWDLLIFNHISMRIPDTDHHFLINPFGLRYDEICASNLIKIDLHGNKLDDSPFGANKAGFVIHSALHENVPEANCIMHTHTNEGMAVASKEAGLINNNFYSAMIGENVSYHDFEGITEHDDEKPRLVASIGSNPIVVLRNHGLLTHGRTIPEAFIRMWTIQKACEAQVQIEGLSGKSIQVSDSATQSSSRDALLFTSNEPRGDLEFSAMQRLVDEKDPSYRH